MKEMKINSFNLSTESKSKIDEVSIRIGRSKSETLERVLIAMPINSMIRYARKNPVYLSPDEVERNGENGERDTII